MGTREHLLDVSGLEPPEPLVRTLNAARTLQSGHYLRMLHRRHPCLLPDNLRKQGFRFLIRAGEHTAVEVFIWREGDGIAEQAVEAEVGSGRNVRRRPAGDRLCVCKEASTVSPS